MDQCSIEEAVRRLQAQGEALSVRAVHRILGYGSFRDISAHLRGIALLPQPSPASADLLPQTDVPERAGGDAALEPAPVLVVQPTLLEAAEATLREATAGANAARRRRDFAPLAERAVCDELLRRRERERRQAQDRVDALTRSRDALVQEVGQGATRVRYAESALAVEHDMARRKLAVAERALEAARQALEEQIADLVAIAGADAVPAMP